MRRSGRSRFFAMALTLATSLFVLFLPAAKAQDDPFASDAILAQGNPPLTESMVTRYTNFTAWFYEIPFTQPQREKIRAILLRDWKKPEEIKNDLSWLTMAADFAKGSPDVREFIRCDLQARNLKAMRADRDPDAQWLVAVYDEAHPPIAAGNPPLTESMVSHYNAFTAWLFEIPLTQSLKDRQRAMLLEDWKKPKDLESDMKVLDWQLEMARYENGEVERLYVRSIVQPDMIKKMRGDKGNPDAQSLVAAYDAAHPTIATGNSKLTRQASDAWTELYCFVRNQSGAPHMDSTQAVKDDFAHALTENWAKYPPEQQKALSEMSQKWALVHFRWVKGKDADRQTILAAWQPIVNPSQPADSQLAAAREAAARVNAFTQRDANTTSEQELLQAAQDADLIAQECRRTGNAQDLVTATKWEEVARNLHAGKAAYAKEQANTQAKAAIIEEYYKSQIMKRALLRKIPTLTPDGRSLEVEPQIRF
jgi:hypothetical protein